MSSVALSLLFSPLILIKDNRALIAYFVLNLIVNILILCDIFALTCMTDIEQLNALRNEYNDRIALIERVREQNPIIVNNFRAAYNNYINIINNVNINN
jgi:hypothetical protein